MKTNIRITFSLLMFLGIIVLTAIAVIPDIGETYQATTGWDTLLTGLIFTITSFALGYRYGKNNESGYSLSFKTGRGNSKCPVCHEMRAISYSYMNSAVGLPDMCAHSLREMLSVTWKVLSARIENIMMRRY